jgi:hypothetical protein
VTGQVAPMVRGLPGVAGAAFFLDREGHAALTLTLWTDEAAAVESDRQADASRSATIAATGVELVSRGRFEVITRF